MSDINELTLTPEEQKVLDSINAHYEKMEREENSRHYNRITEIENEWDERLSWYADKVQQQRLLTRTESEGNV